MAADETLLSMVTTGAPATLRFYRWDTTCLSLGYGQKISSERLAACAAAGVSVVRRVTGGSAVLHGADLTYAVVAREDMLPDGLAGTYSFVGAALIAALESLGITAEAAPRPTAPVARGFDCFAVPAGDEICVGGRKLIGSAQRRSGGGVLQHGSIRFGPDPESARRATGLAGPGATSLQEIDAELSLDTVITACVAAFSAHLNTRIEPTEPTQAERQRVRDRVRARAFEVPIPSS
jgi:lipoate-protein ligase A